MYKFNQELTRTRHCSDVCDVNLDVRMQDGLYYRIAFAMIRLRSDARRTKHLARLPCPTKSCTGKFTSAIERVTCGPTFREGGFHLT